MPIMARSGGPGPVATREEATTGHRPAFEPSFQQADFLDHLARKDDHVLLRARAGSGKSTTCRQGAWLLADQGWRSTYACFNRHIATEFQRDLPRACRAATLHSLGFAMVRASLGDVVVDADKIDKIAAAYFPDRRQRGERLAVCRLVSAAKNLLADADDAGQLRQVAGEHDIELPEGSDQEVLGVVPEVLAKCRDDVRTIDLDDMVWLPVARGMTATPDHDVLFVDECLPGWTPVLLADGSSRTIREIVDGRQDVEVLAYDTKTGVQRPCRVTGWSRTFNRKPLVKIKARWMRRKGGGWPTSFVICTEDHKVWADGRWVPAGEVRPGMMIQVETSATKSQVGKITTRGRQKLALAMSAKNEAGLMPTPTIRRAPVVRGGNGKGPTLAQKVLHEALGDGWTMEHVITTNAHARQLGAPNHYKIDLANPAEKFAIEVDGQSHRGSRREQDGRKEACLRSMGWKVLRVSNRVAIQNTEHVVAEVRESDCPIAAKVVSVEPVSIPDDYVYDISVDGCHDFYANGVLVHNCQDLNPCQHELVMRLAPQARVVVVGDDRQAIYGWRGADHQSLDTLRDRLAVGMTVAEKRLTVTRRCPQAVVRLAQAIVPDLDHLRDAPEGSVGAVPDDRWMEEARPGDMVLCRTNGPLVSACFQLLRDNRRAFVRGRDIGKGLLALIARLRKREVRDLVVAASSHLAREVERANALPNPGPVIQAVQDKVSCLLAMCEGADTVDEVRHRVCTLFSDLSEDNAVLLSSVHRAKGLERDHVIILRPELLPGPWAKRPADQLQELNLAYVAATRARERLTFAGPVPTIFRHRA
jgi:hypothetical protein